MIILCCCDPSLPVAVIHSDQVKLVTHFSDKYVYLLFSAFPKVTRLTGFS